MALAATANLEETAALLWQAPAALAFPDRPPAFAATALEQAHTTSLPASARRPMTRRLQSGGRPKRSPRVAARFSE
ncbi:MAG TPA: hypothetical protein VNW89_01085 [Stellaceae bacterium]|nr:hypothetical protein [Stellaceae bacterium]